MTQQILGLDIAGNPFEWLHPNDAAHYYVTGKVAWELGDQDIVLHGGTSKAGIQSILRIKPVIAIANSEMMSRMMRDYIPLGDNNDMLFSRDRFTCAYCGQKYPRRLLTRDHIVPRCRGGADTWENCVASCSACNSAKGAKSVEEFRPLVFVPYRPCRWEAFLLSGRNVLADQHDYLAASLPKHSRALN